MPALYPPLLTVLVLHLFKLDWFCLEEWIFSVIKWIFVSPAVLTQMTKNIVANHGFLVFVLLYCGRRPWLVGTMKQSELGESPLMTIPTGGTFSPRLKCEQPRQFHLFFTCRLSLSLLWTHVDDIISWLISPGIEVKISLNSLGNVAGWLLNQGTMTSEFPFSCQTQSKHHQCSQIEM